MYKNEFIVKICKKKFYNKIKEKMENELYKEIK